jgi:hypothetical protein
MIDRTSPIRKHSRFPVRWPVMYGCEEFISEGTILDVTESGWRVAGAMPVHPGMQVTLHLWPQDKPGRIRVEQATVLWVKGCEFALDVAVLDPEDAAWIADFLDQRLGRWWLHDRQAPALSDTGHHEPSRRADPLRTSDLAIEGVQQELSQRMVTHRASRKENQAALDRVQREAMRMVNGIQVRRALRIRTGHDGIEHN